VATNVNISILAPCSFTATNAPKVCEFIEFKHAITNQLLPLSIMNIELSYLVKD
jgi:hypothetical protein